MPARRGTLLRFVSIVGLYGLSRYIDGLILVFLRQQTAEPFLPAMARNLRVGEALLSVLVHLTFGCTLWLVLMLGLAWLSRQPRREVLSSLAEAVLPLALSVGLTLLSCLSLAISPRFPYGINLVLTVAYEGFFARCLVWGLVGVVMLRAILRTLGSRDEPPPAGDEPTEPSRRWARWATRAAVIVTATLSFAWLTPSEFWRGGEGQGNMFKYVRMAAALAHSGTLDIAQAGVAAGEASLGEFLSYLPAMAGRSLGEARELAAKCLDAASDGRWYRGEIEATRANRAMFRSHQGGIYYIHAPGPGLLLVPAYLMDGALNRWLGWDRQVMVILFWNFLGALLLWEMACAARDLSGVWWPSLATAAALAASPPIWLYTFQVYPELPAAVGLLYCFRKLLIDPSPTKLGILGSSLVLSFLPWLHQKYSVTAVILGLAAAVHLVQNRRHAGETLTGLSLLFGPLLLSAFSILVYNHALTGTVAPDATFRAVGRTSFEPRYGIRGLAGLLFDVENGLFVYSPIYLLALLGSRRLSTEPRSHHQVLLVVMLSYLVVIASFPYWPGAVSSVARYVLSIAPLAVLPMVFVVRRAASDGALAGAGLTFLAASLSMSAAFRDDRITSYNTGLLLHRSLFSDPYQYLPSFLTEGLLGSGPAHFSKLALIALALFALVSFLAPRVVEDPVHAQQETRRFARMSALSAAGILGFVVLAGTALERHPSNPTEKTAPVYRGSRPLSPDSGAEFMVEGEFGFEGKGVWVPSGGTTRFWIRSTRPLPALRVTLGNVPRHNRLRVRERKTEPVQVDLSPSERREVRIPMNDPYVFHGPSADQWVYLLTVHSRTGYVPHDEGASDDTRGLGCYVVIEL